MQITKTFETLQEAEDYIHWLYTRYDSVKLIKAPRFQESGRYHYEVKSAIAPQFPDLRTALVRKNSS